MSEKMKVMNMRKIFHIAVVMIALAALASPTLAALPYYLPDSSYIDDNGKSWDGYKFYENEDEGINVMLTFNVYDMQTYPDEVDWVGDIDFGDDRFLYAYQLFNSTDPTKTKDVISLNLVDLSGDPIPQFLMHLTQAVADPANPDDPDAVMPDPNPSAEQGKWTWSLAGGFVAAGKISTFLIFSSDNAPVAGDFKVKIEEDKPPTPGDDEIPEPASIVLLGGVAALVALRGNRKNRQK